MRALIALALAVSVANAADVPQSSQRDNRIQYVNYHSGDVVVVHASVGFVSRIVLEAGETILTPVHTGFADGWDITARGRILTLQPLSVQVQDTSIKPNAQDWNTNLAVETNKRLYDFEIRLAPENDVQAFYRVEFKYPVEAEANARMMAAKQATDDARVKQTAALPKPANADYSMRAGKRSEAIAPTMAYDDGLFTYLRFPSNQDIPAVFMTTADGFEGKVNTHIHESRRDVVVVQRVARQLILRLGNSVVAIDNNSFDTSGVKP